MKHPRRPSPLHISCGALTTLALIALGYRFERAFEWSLTDAITSMSTAVTIIGALGTGWRIHVLKLRARADEAELKVIELKVRRDELLDGEEDRLLWDSVQVNEDTIPFNNVVVPIKAHRYTRAS